MTPKPRCASAEKLLGSRDSAEQELNAAQSSALQAPPPKAAAPPAPNVHVATQHAMVGPPTLEVVGLALLGMVVDATEL